MACNVDRGTSHAAKGRSRTVHPQTIHPLFMEPGDRSIDVGTSAAGGFRAVGLSLGTGGWGLLAAGWMVVAGLASGCASSSEEYSRGPVDMSVLASEVEGDRVRERFDLNGDGKPDIWKVWIRPNNPNEAPGRSRLLARKDVDMNFDGEVDLTTHYDRDGDILKEEMNLDYDGGIDAVDYYRNGDLYLREMALGADGRPRLWKYYEAGQLTRKERDTDGDGRAELWEYFEAGRLVRVERDVDRDGRPDTTEIQEGEAAAPSGPASETTPKPSQSSE